MALTRQADNHLNRDELLWYLKACGYPADSAACYGFAGACIPFLLMDRAAEINQRLFLMKQILREFSIDLTDQIDLSEILKKVLERGLSRFRLSRLDSVLISEIPAFCEAIYFHYHPEAYSAWFPEGQSPQSQNLTATLPVVLPLGIKSVAASGVFTGVYDYEEKQFHDYFKSLAETIHARSVSSPIAILLCNLGHSTLVSYDARQKRWTFVDVKHHALEHFDDINLLVSTASNYLSGNDYILCSSQLFGVNQQVIDELYRAWRQHPLWIKTHRYEIDKFKLLDFYEANWTHIAAQNGDMNTLKQYFNLQNPQAISNFNHINWFKLSPLQMAIQEGHEAMVAYFLKKGVDPNFGEIESPLMTAYKHNRHRIVGMLRRAGAKLRSDEACPEAYKLSHHESGRMFRNANRTKRLAHDDTSNKFKETRYK